MAPTDIGTRRELFVDDTLIETVKEDAERRLHHPQPREVVIEAEDPWEDTVSDDGTYNGPFYPTVIDDDDCYRLYYRGGRDHEASAGADSEPDQVSDDIVCYAESSDGITWHKPDLGLVEYDGDTANNIVWNGLASGGFSPFKDPRPDCPPDERYKALGKTKTAVAPRFGGPPDGPTKLLFALKSPDGINWSFIEGPKERGAIFTEEHGDFDSQNTAFWDETAGTYRIYFRKRQEVSIDSDADRRFLPEPAEGEPQQVRNIMTATSEDFREWSEPEFLTYPDSPHQELYTNSIRPYHRAPHLLLGVPMRYVEGRGALTDWHEEMTDIQPGRGFTSYTDSLLMSSRDGRTFQRWDEAFLRPGMPEEYGWSYGASSLGWGLVETPADRTGAPPELSFYGPIGYRQGKSKPPHEGPDTAGIQRYTLRMDGFVSITAPLAGGEVITTPLTFGGTELSLNMATSAAGQVRVELQHPDGTPIEGFELDRCSELYGNSIDNSVEWTSSSDLDAIAGDPVRIRFYLIDADIYSFRFDDQ